MTATITDIFRKNLLNDLITGVQSDSDYYYAAIGRADQWDDSDNVPATKNHLSSERNVRLAMQSMKLAESVSLVIPRNTWSAGTIYSAFDDAVEGYPSEPYYVITDENNVYVCVQRGRNTDGTTRTSITSPSGTGTSVIDTGDGYKWRFLYQISTSRVNKFLSANYMPIEYIDSASDDVEQLQFDVQTASTAGEIIQIVITDNGSGYTSTPTVTITGDGSSATATASIAGGEVKRIQMSAFGSGYTRAVVSITGGGGSGATARAVIPPIGGIGADATKTLKSTAIMFNTKPSGTENDTFQVGNDFRQVSIIKNPTDYSGTKLTGASANAMKSLIVADAGAFSLDGDITGDTSGSQAVVVYIDSDTVFYTQNETTGFGSFTTDVGGNITGTSTTTLTTNVDSSAADPFSGEILFHENRAPIIRNTEQAEDIKLIIQL